MLGVGGGRGGGGGPAGGAGGRGGLGRVDWGHDCLGVCWVVVYTMCWCIYLYAHVLGVYM